MAEFSYPPRTQILEWLYGRLKPKRFLHTLGVEQLALQLAWNNRLPLQPVSVAALLHDCAKNIAQDELLCLCGRHGIDLGPNEDYPQLLHAFAGPIVAAEAFGPLPEEVLNAVRYHTTGRAGMSMLEKVIFSADYAEPGRKMFPGLKEARQLLKQDLDKGTLLIVRNTVDYLARQKEKIHPFTLEALQDLQDSSQ